MPTNEFSYEETFNFTATSFEMKYFHEKYTVNERKICQMGFPVRLRRMLWLVSVYIHSVDCSQHYSFSLDFPLALFVVARVG